MKKAGKQKPLFYEGKGQISTHKAAFTQGGLLAFLCMGRAAFQGGGWMGPVYATVPKPLFLTVSLKAFLSQGGAQRAKGKGQERFSPYPGIFCFLQKWG